MQLSDLQHLMQQLGPSMPEISTILQEDIDGWQVVFDEEVSIHIGWQMQPSRVVVSCTLGQPDNEDREQLYRLLLEANRLMTGTLSAKLAVAPPDDQIMLIGEYELVSASLPELQQDLSGFVQLAAGLAVMVSRPVQEALHTLDPSALDLYEGRV